jgi:hypothetical protein
MLFLTDTCFWTHLKELSTNTSVDLRKIMSSFKWGITREVSKEISYFNVGEYFPKEESYLVPISKKELNSVKKKYPFIKELDIADQTLIVAALRDNGIILTDDGDLFMFSDSISIKVLLLPHFFLSLVKSNYLKKNQAYKALRFWEEIGRYKRNYIKKWKIELQNIT